jgi:hypothetical protein
MEMDVQSRNPPNQSPIVRGWIANSARALTGQSWTVIPPRIELQAQDYESQWADISSSSSSASSMDRKGRSSGRRPIRPAPRYRAAAAPGSRAYNRGGEYVTARWEDGLHPMVYSEGLQRCRISFVVVLILTLVIGRDVKDSRNVIHAMPGKLQGNR